MKFTVGSSSLVSLVIPPKTANESGKKPNKVDREKKLDADIASLVKVLNDSKTDIICLQNVVKKSLKKIKDKVKSQYKVIAAEKLGLVILFSKDKWEDDKKKLSYQENNLKGLASIQIDLREKGSDKILRVANGSFKCSDNIQNAYFTDLLKMLKSVNNLAVESRVIALDYVDESEENWNNRFSEMTKNNYNTAMDLTSNKINAIWSLGQKDMSIETLQSSVQVKIVKIDTCSQESSVVNVLDKSEHVRLEHPTRSRARPNRNHTPTKVIKETVLEETTTTDNVKLTEISKEANASKKTITPVSPSKPLTFRQKISNILSRFFQFFINLFSRFKKKENQMQK